MPAPAETKTLEAIDFENDAAQYEHRIKDSLHDMQTEYDNGTDPNRPTVEERLQTELDEKRDAYAEAIAENSAATLGAKVKVRGFSDSYDFTKDKGAFSIRGTKKNLEAAAKKYQFAYDMSGSHAAEEFRGAGADDDAIRELGILLGLGKGKIMRQVKGAPAGTMAEKEESLRDLKNKDGVSFGLTEEDSEAAKLAKLVEEKRSQSAVFVDKDGNEITVHDKGLRNKVKGLTNKFIKKWQKWDRESKEAGWKHGGWKKQAKVIGKKALALAPAAVITAGAGAATSGAAIVVAATAFGVVGAKTAATHNLGKRADALGAREENERTVGNMQNGHDSSKSATGATLVKAFSGASKENLKKNRIKAGVAAFVTAAAVVGGEQLHPLVEHVVSHAWHALSHPGGHSSTEAQGGGIAGRFGAGGGTDPSQHAQATAAHTTTGHNTKPTLAPSNNTLLHPNGVKTPGLPLPPHHAEGAGIHGSKVIEINPKSAHTVDEVFKKAHVNIHDQYNAEAQALKAGDLEKHIINGNPNDYYLTAHGSSNQSAVVNPSPD